MVMPGRSYSAGTQYRQGFNGKENDNDVKGEGNQQDYGMRIYDPRLGRFLSVDPLNIQYPWYTPYQFAGNTPIKAVDLDGSEPDLIGYFGDAPGFAPCIGPVDAKALRGLDNTVEFTKRQVFPRIKGVLRTAAGGAIMWASAPVAYTPVGFTVFAYGTDQGAAGLREIWFGTSQKSITEQVLEDHGLSEQDANTLNTTATGVVGMIPRSDLGGSLSSVSKAVDDIETKAPSKTLQVGTYGEMTKANAKSGLSADHIPSFAAIKKYSESVLGRELTAAEAVLLKKNTLTLVYETKIHQTISRTYGGRNNPLQIALDASNLLKAAQKDIDALTPSLMKAGYTQGDINAAKESLMSGLKNQ